MWYNVNMRMPAKLKEFLKEYESKIILIMGFVLVAVISFEGGIMRGQKTQQNPVVVKAAESQVVCGASSEQGSQAQNLAQEASKNTDSTDLPAKNCAYVGSKNSNKYHLPTCRWAKNIKPENKVCFESAEDAAKKGYQPDKGCIK
jgi:hypothetical protein